MDNNNAEAQSMEYVEDYSDSSGVDVDYSETDTTNYETDAYQNESQGFEDVPQGNVESTASHIDWEGEAKKFQSMYDKTVSDKQRMEEAMLKMAERSLSNNNQNSSVGRNSNESSLPEEEFNPWDAYYKPESPSYKHRMNQERGVVQQAVSEQMNSINEQMLVNNTVNELRNVYRMPEGEIVDFMQFATKPADSLSLDTLVNVWREQSGKRTRVTDSIRAVKNAKEQPRTAGVLQGGKESAPKSEKDKMWGNILSADRSTTL